MLTVRLEACGLGPGTRVLDLGCGGGRHAYACARAGAQVVALDADASLLGEVVGLLGAMAEAGELPDSGGYGALAADGARLPFADGAFDVVLACEVLEHVSDDAAVLAELARVVRPGGLVALSVPRAGPEALNWALSAAYHEVEGGHVRIYRRGQLRRRAVAAGLRPLSSHHAHALHTPYWWLRCLVGVARDDHWLVAAYHRLLVYDIVRKPRALRLVERALDPFLGKSFVLYLRKGAGALTDAPAQGRPADRPLAAGRRPQGPVAPEQALGPVRRLELEATVATIRALQEPSGRIPWFPGGTGDPWNHAEAAMALSAAGHHEAAERAIDWLVSVQRPDGAFHAAYGPGDEVLDRRLDTNGAAYLAAACLHRFLQTKDASALEARLPSIEAAVGFVLDQQRPGGEICWSDAPVGSPGDLCLLAACSSIHLSLRAAAACAGVLGRRWPEVEEAAARLAGALRDRPAAFADKGEYAMDWYYPVLSGALPGASAWRRLEAGWDRFVRVGRGVLCRADGRWVTAAETAECALACLAVGRREDARRLLAWTATHRLASGEYLTGLVYPERSQFPPGERTSYTAAAVVLAADALDLEGTGGGVATRTVLVPDLPEGPS